MNRSLCAAMFRRWTIVPSLALAASLSLAPGTAWACACGCGVFDVGTSSMFPSGSGGTVYLGYDYQDQTINWSGNSRAPAANNGDKDLRTNFFTAGGQYMFNRSWGIQVEVPYWDRKFTTDTNFGSSPPNLVTSQWSDLGDIRIEGIYTGFSEDLSTGLTYGVKLPTGSFQYNSPWSIATPRSAAAARIFCSGVSIAAH